MTETATTLAKETARQAAFAMHLVDNGYTDIEFHGERWAAIRRMAFTHTLLVGQVGDFGGYEHRWCFSHLRGAQDALRDWKGLGWLGEPVGWHLHPDTGRMRPGGNVALETVNQ